MNGHSHISVDLFVLEEDKKTLKLFKFDDKKFTETANLKSFSDEVVNVVPCDFMFDGKTGVIVQTLLNGVYKTYPCTISGGSLDCASPIEMKSEATVFDVNGDNYLDLIAVSDNGTKVWINKGDKTFTEASEYNLPAITATFPITIADMNGDCRADLIFVVENGTTHDIQIYTATTTGGGDYRKIGYSLARTVHTNTKITSISVADVNRNGNIDLIWTSEGNHVNVLFNKQKKVCKSFVKSDSSCRSQTQMCVADDSFSFNEKPDIVYVLGDQATFAVKNGLVPISVADYNIDSYPDLMVGVTDPNHNGTYMMLIKNNQGTEFARESTLKDLITSASTNSVSGAFFDNNNQGLPNMFFNTEDSKNARRVVIVSNNMKPDALFVKILGLNGVCVSSCGSGYSKVSEKPYGANYFGGVFKLALTNTDGNNVGLTSIQVSQTSHNALQTPYSHIGLGRISNYIQVVDFGTNMNVSVNHAQFQSIIPNSQLVVIPHPPTKASRWTIELYFLDLNLMFWIGIAMTIALVILGVVMLVLFIRDKKKEAESHLLNMK